jgi:DNA-binding response OmpR family regulator
MDGIRLLYVDRSRVAARRLCEAMDVAADTFSAGSIAEAQQAVAEQNISFLITEQDLPDGDGLDLIRWLRAQPGHDQTPTILYTAALDNDLEYRAMKAGANESHAKPTDLLELCQRVIALAHLPEVRFVRRELLQMTCFGWRADGKHHAYSPDLNIHVEGPTADTVREHMQRLLDREIRAKANPADYPADSYTMKFIVKLASNASAA